MALPAPSQFLGDQDVMASSAGEVNSPASAGSAGGSHPVRRELPAGKVFPSAQDIPAAGR